MSSSPTPPISDLLYIEEPAWWRTVAWPQVLTLVAFVVAVLAPVMLALLLAA